MAEKKAQSTKPENAGQQDAAPLTAIDPELEMEKVRGQTDSQQEYREYHEGEFQSTDPITGEKRDLNQAPARVDLTEGDK
jgi:hypothetical protein